jgi:hypothetical protein
MEGWYGVKRPDSSDSSGYSPAAGSVKYNNGLLDCIQGKEFE